MSLAARNPGDETVFNLPLAYGRLTLGSQTPQPRQS